MSDWDSYGLPKIPEEVIRSAITVARWVESQIPELHDVRIYGVGTRFFLSITEMLKERQPGERISELRATSDGEVKHER
jgi:hypothetical protein